MTVSSAYTARIISVYATHWRRDGKAPAPIAENFELGDRLSKFYSVFRDQLPLLLAHDQLDPEQIAVAGAPTRPQVPMISAEVFLFALPFPANQVVAALAVDFETVDVNDDQTPTRAVLESMADADIQIADQTIATHVDKLCRDTGTMEKKVNPQGELIGLPIERHQLILIGELNGAPRPLEGVVASILYQLSPPYRQVFTAAQKPAGLNQQEGTFAAVTTNASFLFGHPDEVETSVFLTTVQAVGTASRFQQIWQDAYHEVNDFQLNKQAHQVGVQQRGDLERLADEMGNLELDLAFSVEAAADLGSPIPSYSIATFHDSLYEAIQIRARARTVSQMFVRLGGSIRSELTAIESRERQESEARRHDEEKRRLRAALAFGFISFVAIPLSFILGFFGINASQIDPNASMWSHRYLAVYEVAGALAALPVAWLAVVYAPTLYRNAFHTMPKQTKPLHPAARSETRATEPQP